MGGSIMTFYELTEGDMAHTTGKLGFHSPIPSSTTCSKSLSLAM